MTEQIVFNNLLDFHKAAENAGVKYWLCEGLLLGIYRDGGPIKGDEDDTDVGIELIGEKKRKKFILELKKRGLEPCNLGGKIRDKNCVEGRLESIQVCRDGNRIDISLVRDSGEIQYMVSKDYHLVFPGKFFSGDNTIEWKGKTFNTVNNIVDFLEYKYRNWKIPKLRGDGYQYSDRSLNRAYVTDFDINNPIIPE